MLVEDTGPAPEVPAHGGTHSRRTGIPPSSLMAMSKVGGIDDPVWTLPPSESAQLGRPTGRQRVAGIALLAIIGFGVVYPVAAAVLSRQDYGTFAFWKVPSRIDYCGRRYFDGGPQRGSPALFESQDSARDTRWTFLSWTFSGRSIYADVNPVKPPYSVCTMVLYIPLGGGRWETYGLSGGP
jgi:hypothetical protein